MNSLSRISDDGTNEVLLLLKTGCNEEETNGTSFQDETGATSPSLRNGASQSNSNNNLKLEI